MRNYLYLLLLLSNFTVHYSYANNCAQALGLKKELDAFYASRKAFRNNPSLESQKEMILRFNHLRARANAAPNTPLHLAASRNDLPKISQIVSSGTSVEEPGHNGMTPLSTAAIYGHIDAINLLLELGAKIDNPDIMGFTPLSYASQPHIIRHLVERGAGIDRASITGETPIMVAAREGNQDKFRTLASLGASLTVIDINGYTLLHKVIIYPEVNDRVGMVNLVLDTITDWPEPGIIHWPDPVFYNTPLHWAAWEGHTDVISALLKNNASLTSANTRGELPVHLAARNNKASAFLRLLREARQRNLDHLNAVDGQDQTPADLARSYHASRVLGALGL